MDGGQPDAAPNSRTFTGVVGFQGVEYDPSSFEPADLSTWTILARAGGRSYPGVGLPDGTFSIEAPAGELEVELVAPGENVWVYEKTLLRTSLDRVRLVFVDPTRSRLRAPAGTRLRLSGRLGAPWTERDELGLAVPADWVSVALTPAPRVGESSAGPWNLAWAGQPNLRGGPDDDLMVARWTSSSTTPFTGERTLTELAVVPDVDVADRQPRSFVMSRLPTESRAVDFDLSLVEPSDLPGAELGSRYVTLRGRPRAATRTRTNFGLLGLLLLWDFSRAPESARSLTRNLPTAPPGFDLCAAAGATIVVRYNAPNQLTAFVGARMMDCRPGWRFPLVLSLSAPRDLRINGVPVASLPSSVGATPTVTWEPPAQGRVSAYEVTMLGFGPDGRFHARSAWTPRTSLTLPEGWLEPGFLYSLTVAAIDREDEVVGHPFEIGLREERYTVSSQTFTR